MKQVQHSPACQDRMVVQPAHYGQAVKNIETVKVRNVVEVDVSKGVAVARVTNALKKAGGTTVSFTTAV